MNLNRIAPLLAACSVLAMGCGEAKVEVSSGKQLNEAKAERVIAQGIEEQTTAKNVSVSCPEVEIKRNKTFKCTATAQGDKATVDVRQLDDKGNIRWKLGK